MPAMPAPGEWTYVDPTASDVDQVRYWLQDTNPDVRLLADLELQFLIDEWMPRYDSFIMVASIAAENVAAKFAGTVSVSADGVTVDVSSLSERYLQLAARLRQLHHKAQIGGEVDITGLMWDPQEDYSIKPLSFGVGMHDNREAGRQEYGSHRGWWEYEDTVRPGA